MGRKNPYIAAAASTFLLAAVALDTMPARADDSPSRQLAPVKHAPAAPDISGATDAGGTFKVSIPTIDAKDSSIDGDTLKKIFSGDFLAHANDLAKLSATSIHIPEIDVSYVPSGASSAGPITYVYKNVDADHVRNGIAEAVSIGGLEGAQTGAMTYKFGKASMHQFDIGGLLAFYGLVPNTDQTMKTMYKNVDFDGGSFSGPDFKCDIGAFHSDEFKARPLKMPMADLFKLLTSGQLKKTDPSPEAIGKLIGLYADMLTAFETSPSVLQKLACDGKDDKGEPVAVSVGPLTIGSFAKGKYPAIEAKNLAIDTAGSGKLSIASVTMKSMDLTSVLAALQSAPAAPTQDWFTANARKFIPAFAGFAFNGLKLDAPDSDRPGQRIKATVADYDLSLGDYFAGIPTKVSTSANHIVIDVPPPAEGDDDSMKALQDMGIKTLDLGFDFAMHRDAEAKTIVIDKAEARGEHLGSFNFAGTIGNVDDALFTADQNTILPLAMALTLKSVKVDAVDAGFADLVLQRVAKDQSSNVGAVRAMVSGGAQGMVLQVLGDTPSGKVVGDAVAKFIAGAKSISIAIAAKDPAGLTTIDLAAAQADPTALTSKVTIDATAK